MGGIFLRLTLILLLALSAPGAAWAQVFEQPWNLAVVVAGSPQMEKPWQNEPMREILQRALTMELRTLPLRATAGVWLAGEEPAPLVPPTSSAQLKRVDLEIPAQAKPASPKKAIQQALAWLKEQGSGALILLAAGEISQAEAGWPDIDREEVFCHSLELGTQASSPSLAALALAGGGEYLAVKKPGRLPFTLRKLFRVALSPARLVINAHDPENRALDLTLEIQRRKRKEPARAMKSNRPVQVLAGVYEIHWPTDSGAGPGPLPELASVGRQGLIQIWAGGQGELSVRAQDAEGKDLVWHLKVSDQDDGRVVVPERKTPFEVELPAGFYIASVRHPRLAWSLEVRPGRTVKLVAGPKAQLTLSLKGPAGPLRLPYEVHSFLEGRRVATGYTNAPIRLLPGPYRLKLESAPPAVREITLNPGEQKALEFTSLGALLVADPGPQGPNAYQVTNLTGRVIARGRPGKSLLLLPGIYLVQTAEAREGSKVRIMEGQVSEGELPPKAR